MTEPILRIEAGRHIALITAIASDAQGRYAVTVSQDKTARVWDLASGRAGAILRPPIGPGPLGWLNATAMSPDGETVAVAGLPTRKAAFSKIYLFSRSSGLLIRTLPSMPVVWRMAFSPDGQWLAAGTFNSGIQLLKWQDPDQNVSQDLSDPDIHGAVASLSWSADNHLAVAAKDSQLRLYQVQNGRLQKLVQVPCGTDGTPAGIAFSPDGRSVAVGYGDNKPIVVIADAHTLRPVYRPDVSGVGTGDLGNVAWSSDGSTLYAAGTAERNDANYVRVWAAEGHGKPIDVRTVKSPVTDLKTLSGEKRGNAGVLVAGGDLGWGIVDGSARWHGQLPPNATFVAPDGKGIVVPLSRDAREVQFAYAQDPPRGPQYIFSLETRQLRRSNSTVLAGPQITGLPVRLQDGKVLLNNLPIAAVADDPAISLAIAPSGDSFVVGGFAYISRLDASGNLLWRTLNPALVAIVNIPASGQIVVAGSDDGTIRWYRLSDGQELLAFFSHADRKRWVLWTPSGYFDASPGGEELIGWHVNRGIDEAADFFPASRFRSRFYRPDVIDRVLDSLDETRALTAADAARGGHTSIQASSIMQALPPVVELVSASDLSVSQAQLAIRYRTRSAADSPVTRVFARVDGLAQSTARRIDVVGADGSQEIMVDLPAHDSEVQLFAESRNGVSTAASVRVKWAGAAASDAAVPRTADSAGFQIQPKLYMLAVGVSAYQSKDIPKLTFAAKDARDFTQALQRQQGKLYKTVEVKVITDDKATKDEILDGLEWLGKQVTQHDVGILFLSGHGAIDPGLGYVYLPVNADPDKLKRTAVTMADLITTFHSIAGKTVAFLDTCHSGNVLGPAQKGLVDTSGAINELASAENGVVVFSSSTSRQFSLENASWNNGAFTKALVEGLDGSADERHSGRVTFKMLDLYVSERVKALTQGNQSPVTQAPGGVNDFPLALTR